MLPRHTAQTSRRLPRSLSLGLMLATGMAAASPARADVVKIGLLVQLTGASSADGEEIVRGAKMAIEDTNAKGGVSGHTFDLVVGDTKDGAASDVQAAVERLLSDKDVHFMVSGYASLTSFEIDNMKEADMPYMLAGPSGQTRSIVAADPESYWCCWSLNPSFDAYNTDVPGYIQKLAADGKVKLGSSKKVALISSDNAYSNTIHDGLKAKFGELGWTVTVDEVVPFGDVNDWGPVLAKVRQNAPDLVIDLDYLPKNAARFTEQFMEAPTQSLLFLQYAPSVPEFVDLTGAKSQGVIYDLLGGVLNTPKNQRAIELQSKFKAKYGTESGTYGITIYEEMNIYFDALAKVKDPRQHEAIGKAIGETSKPVAEGQLKFDPKTHLAVEGDDALPMQFYQIQDKQRVLIAPSQYAVGQFKLPSYANK